MPHDTYVAQESAKQSNLAPTGLLCQIFGPTVKNVLGNTQVKQNLPHRADPNRL